MTDNTETVQNWLEAGKSSRANAYIHPCGDISDEAYWKSGREDASTVIKKVGNVESILEYGCGNGRILSCLHHPRAYGVDISPDVIAGLLNACLVSEFNKSVDCIYSVSVFIHLNQYQAMEALEWIYTHLNLGGKAYLQIPLYDVDREPCSFIDVGVWSLKTFVDCVTQVGFKVREVSINEGEFSYEHIGKKHSEFQVLQK